MWAMNTGKVLRQELPYRTFEGTYQIIFIGKLICWGRVNGELLRMLRVASTALLLPSADLWPRLIHLAHHRKSCSIQCCIKWHEMVCKGFLHVGFEGSSPPGRSRAQHSSTGCRLHPAHTGSQGSCSGFNFTLVYLSVQSLPFSFNRVSASLRPYIMVFISPLPSALVWWIKGNLQGKRFCCAFSSSLPPALCPSIPPL